MNRHQKRKKRTKTKIPIGSSFAGNIKRRLQREITEREEILVGGPEGLIAENFRKKLPLNLPLSHKILDENNFLEKLDFTDFV